MEELKNDKKLFKTLEYEVLIFLFLTISLLVRLEPVLESWKATYYAMNYSYGFIPRGLIGTIFNWVVKGNISASNAWLFVFVFTVILNILISILLGKLIRKTKGDNNNKKTVAWFVGIYLVMPFMVRYLYGTNMGRLDLFLYIITILQILLLTKYNNLITQIITLLLSVICVAIHEAYIWFVFPILFVVLTYNLYLKSFKPKNCFVFILICLSVLLSTMYFQFFAEIKSDSVEQLTTHLSNITDLAINPQTLDLEYFNHSFDMHLAFTSKYLSKNIFGISVSTIILSPVIAIILILRKKAFELAKKNNKKFYWTLVIMQLAILLYIPAFCFTSDWGRWLIGLFNYELAIIIFAIIENQELFDFLKLIKEKADNAKMILIPYLILVLAAGNFTSTGVIESGSKLFQLYMYYN